MDLTNASQSSRAALAASAPVLSSLNGLHPALLQKAAASLAPTQHGA